MNILEVSNALLQSDDENDQDAVDALAALDELANLSRRKAKRVRLRNREDYLYKEKYSSHVSVPMCPRWTHSCWWTKYFIGSEFILRPDDPAWNTKYYNPDHPNFERDIDVQDSPSNRKFRQRFRVPKWYFHQLVSEVRAAGWFPGKTITGRYVIPLELQIAGVLRHLGRDWVSDDVSESAGICPESHRRFFHTFLDKFDSLQGMAGSTVNSC